MYSMMSRFASPAQKLFAQIAEEAQLGDVKKNAEKVKRMTAG